MKATPFTAVKFVKLCAMISGCYPPPLHSSKLVHAVYNIGKLVITVSLLSFLIPLATATYIMRSDMRVFPKSVTLVCALVYAIATLAVFHIQQRRFQMLNYDVNQFLQGASPRDLTVLQYYVDKCSTVYIMTATVCYTAASFVCCLPLFLPGVQFPADAIYPFPVNNSPMKQIIYLHQTVSGLQVSSAMCADNFATFLLWYSIARLHLLAIDFQNVRNQDDFRRITRETTVAIEFLILINLMTTTIAIAFGALFLLTPQMFIVKLIFASVIFAANILIFLICWTSDHLIEMSSSLGYAFYQSEWVSWSTALSKNLVLISLKTQSPIVVSVKNVVKELSLEYFGFVMYMTFKYFTAMNTVLLENN